MGNWMHKMFMAHALRRADEKGWGPDFTGLGLLCIPRKICRMDP